MAEEAQGFDEGELVVEIEKGRDVIRIRRTQFKGYKLVDLRIFWEDKEGAWKPGKGLAFREELLPDVIVGLQEAAKRAGVDE